MENYLFKFLSKESYVEEFRMGKIRLMSAYYYATLEQAKDSFCNNRFDATDGKSFLLNRENAKEAMDIQFANNTKIQIGPGVESILINSEGSSKQLKISCYYALNRADIREGKFKNVLDTMEDSLGDYYITFLDPSEFARRVQNEVEKLKIQGIVKDFGMKCVEYYDANKFTGVAGPFLKPDILKWQREYRLLIETIEQSDPFYIDIGDIRDITMWGKVEDLYNGYIVDENTTYLPNVWK